MTPQPNEHSRTGRRPAPIATALDAVHYPQDDLRQHDGRPMVFPPHARSFVGNLTLRETPELTAAAGVVVGNDSGLRNVTDEVSGRAVSGVGMEPAR